MARAIKLATTRGVPLGPNPRVGCVLLEPNGTVVGEGYHRGSGTPHAEIAALAQAGSTAHGATAVVTLEPCNHAGRTGPCTDALLQSGVRRVVFATSDPNPIAAGGAQRLANADVEVESGLLEQDANRVNRAWLHGLAHRRPLVTWKFASTIDGRVAAADGSSRWISNRAARRDVHRLRAEVDCVLVGTGTAADDDPRLTARDVLGRPIDHQPLRVVMGRRHLDEGLHVIREPALRLRTHDPRTALEELFWIVRRHVLLEGGPTLAAAFVRSGMVDEIVAYVAPALLGSGPTATADLGLASIRQALRFSVAHADLVADEDEEPNVRLMLAARGSVRGGESTTREGVTAIGNLPPMNQPPEHAP